MGAGCCAVADQVRTQPLLQPLSPPFWRRTGLPQPHCAVRYASVLDGGGCVLFNGAVALVQFAGLSAVLGGVAQLRKDAAQTLQDALQHAVDIIHAHGGDVLSITGQKLLALWDQSAFEGMGIHQGRDPGWDEESPTRYEALFGAVQCMLELRDYTASVPFLHPTAAVSYGNLALSAQPTPPRGSTLLTTGRPIAFLTEAEAVLNAEGAEAAGVLVSADAWAALAAHCQATRLPTCSMWWVERLDAKPEICPSAFLNTQPSAPADSLNVGGRTAASRASQAPRPPDLPGVLEKATVVTLFLPKALLAEDDCIPHFLESVAKDIVQDDGELVQLAQRQRSSLSTTVLFGAGRPLRAALVLQRCIDLSQRLWDMRMHFAVVCGPAFWGSVTAGGQQVKVLAGPAALISINLASAVDITGHLLWCNAAAVAECSSKYEIEFLGMRKLDGEFHVSLFVSDQRHKQDGVLLPQLQARMEWHGCKVSGRERERAVLDEAVHGMLQGTLQTPIVSCFGHGGMGKSTLAVYMQQRWAFLPLAVVDCSDMDPMKCLSACPLLFEELFSLVRYTCKGEDRIAQLTCEELICWLLDVPLASDLLPPLDAVLNTHFVSAALPPAGMDSACLKVDEVSEHAEVFKAVRTLGLLLRSILARLGCLILCCDNAHSMDTASWQVLQDFVDWAHKDHKPCLLLLCSDPMQETACLVTEPKAHLVLPLTLSELDDDDIAIYLADAFEDRMLPGDVVSPELVLSVKTATWGHPLFLSELCAYMKKKRLAVSVDGRGMLCASLETTVSLANVDFTACKPIRQRVHRMFVDLPEIMQTILQTAAAVVTDDNHVIYPQMIVAVFPVEMRPEVLFNLKVLAKKGLLTPGREGGESLVLTWDGPVYQFAMRMMPDLLRQALSRVRLVKINRHLAQLLAKEKSHIRRDARNYRLWATYCYRSGNHGLVKMALELEAEELLLNNHLDRHASVMQELTQLSSSVSASAEELLHSMPPSPVAAGLFTSRLRPEPSPSRRLLPFTPKRLAPDKRALVRSDLLEIDCMHAQLLVFCKKLKSRKPNQLVAATHELNRRLKMLKQAYQLPTLYVLQRETISDLMGQLEEAAKSLTPSTTNGLVDLLLQLVRTFATSTENKLPPMKMYEDAVRWTPVTLIHTKYEEAAAAQRELFHLWRQLAAACSRSQSMDALEQHRVTHLLQRVMDLFVRLFAQEESLMGLMGYPYLEDHRQAHQKFIEKLLDVFAQFSMGMLQTDVEVLQCLHQYTTTHVPISDRMFAAWMAGRLGDAVLPRSRLAEMCLAGTLDAALNNSLSDSYPDNLLNAEPEPLFFRLNSS
eukprot:EG_transcript_272